MDRLDDPRLVRFLEAAKRFRDLIDNVELKGRDLLRALFHPLAELYAAGVGLGEVDLEERPEVELEPRAKPHAEMRPLCERIGADAGYWMIYDPTRAKDDEAPVAGNLGDDLADIYSDVVPGLMGWEKDPRVYGAKALFEWRVQFGSHWGPHALDALNVISRVERDEGWGGAFRECERGFEKGKGHSPPPT